MGCLRLFLAVCVVSGHAGPLFGLTLPSSNSAVLVFFIISGFYMTLICTGKYGHDRAGVRLFYENRLLRLFPAYLLVLALSVLFPIVFADGDFPGYSTIENSFDGAGLLAQFLIVFSNLTMVFSEASLFFNLDLSSGQFVPLGAAGATGPLGHSFLYVPQIWTVGVELLFYITAPFVVHRFRLVMALLSASLLLRLGLASGGFDYEPWGYRFLPSLYWFFMTGAALCHGYMAFRARDRAFLNSGNIALVGLALISLILMDSFNHGYVHASRYVLYALPVPFLFHLTRNLHWDRMIGDLSYPVYVNHFLIFQASVYFLDVSLFVRGAVVTFFSVVLAGLMVFLIELPVDRYRQKLARRQGAMT
jgi:peptidoglycan/LPS O-acetylase OafA/YrhL